MMTIRLGEQGQPPERHERYFEQDNYWYYTTREGVNIGPFDNRSDAAVGCSDFIDFICVSDPSFSSTLQQYSQHVA